MKTAASVATALLAAAVALAPLWGQEEGYAPDKGVARLSLINGDVSVKRGDSGDQTAGAVNQPLLAGDRVLTDGSSRAEVQFDASNFIRLGPMTELRLGELTDRRYEAQLATGMLLVRVMRDSDAHLEILTPSVSIRLTRRGSYRVTVFPEGSGEITVRSGEAEVFTPRGSEVVRAGKSMRVRGTAADPEFQIENEPPEDDFDRWNRNRDRDLERSISYRYVPGGVYGVEALDPYGSWVYDAPYGWVWVPRVAPGWAPYRVGRWSWVNYYGWTWYSADPWGWAPYHWGSWYYGTRGWCWFPGAWGPRYYWRPGLVAFFGWGAGGISVGFNFGYGNLGWVPLAPYERFRPWYGPGYFAGGRTVINNIRIVNNTDITNIYRNSRVINAGNTGVTSVRAGDFGRRAVDSGNFVRAGERDLRGVGDLHGALPVDPSPESRRFSERAVNARAFPRSDDNATFFRGAAREPGRDASGQREPSGGARAGERAVTPPGGTFRGSAVDAPPAGRAERGTGSERSVSDRRGDRTDGTAGWRRIGESPAATESRGRESAVSPQASPGWRQFEPSDRGPARDSGVRGTLRGDSPRSAPEQMQAPPAQTPRSADRGQPGGWRVFDGTNGGPRQAEPGFRTDPPARIEPRSPAPRMESPRGDSGRSFSLPSAPRESAPRGQGGGQQPIRINPPIVRDRGGFDGGTRGGVMGNPGGGFGRAPSGGAPVIRGSGGGVMGGGGGGPSRSSGGAPSGGGGGGPRGRGR